MEFVVDYFRTNGLVFELWVAVLAFVWQAPRRPSSRLRIAFCVLVTVAGWAVWTLVLPDNAWTSMIGFVVLLTGFLWVVRFCWQYSLRSAVFYVVAAAVLQHMAFRGAHAVAVFSEAFLSASSQTSDFIYVVVLVPLCVVGYYLFAKPLSSRPVGRIGSVSVALLVAGMLIFVNLFTRLFAEAGGEKLPQINLIYSLFDFTTSIFMLALMTQIVWRQGAENEAQVLQRLLHQQKAQLETSRENNELISIKTHDLKKQIGLLEDRISRREVEELRTMVASYESTVATGNETVDILLAEKLVTCNERDIRFDRMVDGESLDFMSAADTYALLGNAIDNAIEAVSQLDHDSRYVDMRIKRAQGFVLVELVNPFEGPRKFVEGLPQSTKGDRRYHGFGMRSIRMVAEKYKGHMSAEVEDELFVLRVLVPEPPESWRSSD
ncbi:GHKL domain-containing protein [Actinomycetaceae bacterium MB13-C1-2]|nr:GHKL domain-containing protein [Actinomycetaceae bacterium MB13-C1-2]